MKIKGLISIFLILIIGSSCSFSQKSLTTQTDASNFQIIKNVRLITMSDSLIRKNMSVVLHKDTIHWIGKTKQLPEYPNSNIVEGNHSFLMPGLSDMHVHIRSELELYSYLYYGVTTILQMSGPNGDIDLFELRDNLKTDSVIGPMLYMTGPMLDGSPAIWNEPVSLSIDSPEKGREVVKMQFEAGYDFIKIYNRLSKPSLDAVLNTANESGVSVIGHIPRAPGAVYAIEKGERMIAHMEEFFFSYFDCVKCGKEKFPDESKIPALVKVVKDNGTWVTPNLSFIAATRFQLNDFDKVISDPEFKYLTAGNQSNWRRFNPTTRDDLRTFGARERLKYDLCQKLTLEFNRAGVPLLTGSDASASGMYPGKSLHLELVELSKAGLNNYEVLKASTYNPGKFIGDFTKNNELGFGEIKVGNRADLLLLGINPLGNIRFENHIIKVISKGKILEREEINSLRNKLIEN